MKMLNFEVGDDCWIFTSGHHGEMTQGKVMLKTKLPERLGYYYIISIDTPVDEILELRDGLCMSDAEDKPIGMWRKSS